MIEPFVTLKLGNMGLFSFFHRCGSEILSSSKNSQMPTKVKIAKSKFSYTTNEKRNRKQIERIIESNPELLDNYDKRTLRRKLKHSNITVRDGILQEEYLTDDEKESVNGLQCNEGLVNEEVSQTGEKTDKGAIFPNLPELVSETSDTVDACIKRCDETGATSKSKCETLRQWSPLAERLPSSCSDDNDTFNNSFLRRDEHGNMVDRDGVIYISDDD